MTAKFDPSVLYDRFEITIQLRDRCFGGRPKNKDLIKAWIKARTGYDDEQTEVQTAEALTELAEDVAEGMWTGFPVGDGGRLFVDTRQIKAMMREGSTLLGITKKKIGSKQIIQHGFEVKGLEDERRIYFLNAFGADCRGLTEPDGMEEGPIHVQTARGPRTALKRQDYVERRALTFHIWILKTGATEKRHLGEDDLVHMLTHAQENGLGASRSQGHGKFDVVSFKKL